MENTAQSGTGRDVVITVARPRWKRQRVRENLDAYILIGPWLLGFLGLTVGPIIGSAVLAFAQWNLLTPPRLIGSANFQTMLSDDLFWTSLYNTAYYTFFGVPIYLIVALVAAIAVNVRLKLINFYRTMLYLPSVTPSVALVLLGTESYKDAAAKFVPKIDALLKKAKQDYGG